MKSSNYYNYYKRLALALALVLVLLTAFVACDGGAGGDETSESTPNETTGGNPADSNAGSESDDGTGATGGETGGSNAGGSEASGTTGSGASGENTTGGTSGGDAEPTGDVTYTVTVVDGTGNPLKNVIVKFSNDKQAATNSSGVATMKAPAGTYTFLLEMIGGGDTEYLYNAAACILSADSPSVTISFVEKVSTGGSGNGGSSGGDSGSSSGGDSSGSGTGTGGSGSGDSSGSGTGGDATDDTKGDTIWADPDGDDTRTEYYAPYVYTGSVAVDLAANDMTYVLFYPQVAGQYRVSATCSTATVSVGYYGVPSYVQTRNVATTAGTSYFELNVRAGSIRTLETGTLIVVVGLKTTDGSAGTALLTIERFADALTDTADVPYEEIEVESQYLKETPAVSGTLTDIDITKEDITIVKGSDGYYHYGTESGPIVMLRLSTASPYIDSFVKIEECQSLAYYEYDANGTFVRKERWNAVVRALAAYANDDGVVPLNDQLITMLQNVGTHMGWWDEDHPQYIFKDVDEVTKNAYLFACCYYA